MAKTKSKKESFKDKAKKKSGGSVRRLGEGETAEVRFLFEMSDSVNGWGSLAGYFDEPEQRSKFYEDAEDGPEGVVLKDAFFTVAIDIEEGSIDVWELRKTLVLALVEYEEEYSSITDRNYKLKRRGQGMKTKYTATPMDSSPMTKKMNKMIEVAEGKMASALADLLAFTD